MDKVFLDICRHVFIRTHSGICPLYYRKRRQAGLPHEAGYPDQRQGGCPEQNEAKEVKELNRRRSDHHRLCCIMLDCRVTWND